MITGRTQAAFAQTAAGAGRIGWMVSASHLGLCFPQKSLGGFRKETISGDLVDSIAASAAVRPKPVRAFEVEPIEKPVQIPVGGKGSISPGVGPPGLGPPEPSRSGSSRVWTVQRETAEY